LDVLVHIEQHDVAGLKPFSFGKPAGQVLLAFNRTVDSWRDEMIN